MTGFFSFPIFALNWKSISKKDKNFFFKRHLKVILHSVNMACFELFEFFGETKAWVYNCCVFIHEKEMKKHEHDCASISARKILEFFCDLLFCVHPWRQRQ